MILLRTKPHSPFSPICLQEPLRACEMAKYQRWLAPKSAVHKLLGEYIEIDERRWTQNYIYSDTKKISLSGVGCPGPSEKQVTQWDKIRTHASQLIDKSWSWLVPNDDCDDDMSEFDINDLELSQIRILDGGKYDFAFTFSSQFCRDLGLGCIVEFKNDEPVSSLWAR
jgi:hypothetical protein